MQVSLDFPTIIGPVQQSLSLAWTAKRIARFTILAELGDMPSERLPALDLPIVLLRHSAAHIIAAVPLKPATRIIRVEPAVVLPHGQGLASIDAKVI